ncbi:MAG: hypothetical protein FWE38_03890 [Firmicutes bacterium]|nr:hypothetical protein [Bacillota bacterium]
MIKRALILVVAFAFVMALAIVPGAFNRVSTASGMPTTSWADNRVDVPLAEDGVIVIRTAAEFAGFAHSVNTVTLHRTANVRLGADINLSAHLWRPIGDGYIFGGTFNGNGHTITGLNISGTSSAIGLFGTIGDGAVIGDLVIENSTVGIESGPTGLSAGIVVGSVNRGNATVEDITIRNSALVGSTQEISQSLGGIIGAVSFSGTNVTMRDITMDNVEVIREREPLAIGGGSIMMGGTVGFLGSNATLTIENTDITSGALTSIGNNSVMIGGMVAQSSGSGSDLVIRNSIFEGTIDARDGNGVLAGGMVGFSSGAEMRIENSRTNGTMNTFGGNGESIIGGIAGAMSGSNGFVMESVSNMTININESTTPNGERFIVGGNVGRVQSGANLVMNTGHDASGRRLAFGGSINATSSPATATNSYAGGLVGEVLTSAVTIMNAGVNADIYTRATNLTHVGGIIGDVWNSNVTLTDITVVPGVDAQTTGHLRVGGAVGNAVLTVSNMIGIDGVHIQPGTMRAWSTGGTGINQILGALVGHQVGGLITIAGTTVTSSFLMNNAPSIIRVGFSVGSVQGGGITSIGVVGTFTGNRTLGVVNSDNTPPEATNMVGHRDTGTQVFILPFVPRTLRAPTNLAVTPLGLLTWWASPQAHEYQIRVNGTEVGRISGAVREFNLATIENPPPYGDHSVTVIAMGPEGAGTNSPESTAATWTRLPPPLATPGIPTISVNMLTWPPVFGAAGFRIYISHNQGEFTLRGHSISAAIPLSELNPGLAVGENRIRIVANGVAGVSSDSAPGPHLTHIIDPQPFATPVITIDGGTISWQDIPNTGGFRVYVDRGASEWEALHTVSAEHRSFNLNDLNPRLPIGYHTISVIAAGIDGGNLDSQRSNTVEFHSVAVDLAAPTGLVVNGNNLSWSHVPNAAGYHIYTHQNGIDLRRTQNPIQGTGTDTRTFNLATLGLAPGVYTIRIRAMGGGSIEWNDSALSHIDGPSFTVTGPLAAPVGLTITGGGILSWTHVLGATGYHIYVRIGGVDIRQTTAPVTGGGSPTRTFNMSEFTIPVGTFHVRVLATSTAHYLTDSPLSDLNTAPLLVITPATPDPVPLLAPANVVRVDNFLRWTHVVNADAYHIYTRQGNIDTRRTIEPITGGTSPTREFNLWYLGLEPGFYILRVRAVSNSPLWLPSPLTNLNFAPSWTVDETTMPPDPTPLPTPTGVAISGSILSWTHVPTATGYFIYTRQGLVDLRRTPNPIALTGGTTRFFDLTTLDLPIGTHNVRVRATTTSILWLDSALSIDGIQFHVQGIVEPQPIPAPTGLVLNQNTGIMSWNPVTGATGYRVYANTGNEGFREIHRMSGTWMTSMNLNNISTPLGDGIHIIRVVAVGQPGISLDSAPSNTVTFTIGVGVTPLPLSAPTNVTVNQGTGLLSWSSVHGATHYRIYVGGVYRQTIPSTYTSFNINNFNTSLEPGTHNITIVAGGATGVSLDSPHSPSVIFTVAGAPPAGGGSNAAIVISVIIGILAAGGVAAFIFLKQRKRSNNQD